MTAGAAMKYKKLGSSDLEVGHQQQRGLANLRAIVVVQ
jgi:hypothetical protein